MARIAVVGTGYVGLTTGACFAHMGHSVSCIDIDVTKIGRLRSGDIPIYEPGLKELVDANVKSGRLSFTTDYREGLTEAGFVFIAVGTPALEDGRPDMTYVHTAAREIGRSLSSRAIIVDKSTTPIGTAGTIAGLLEEVNPALAPWIVVSNPEFLREGSAVDDCLYPDRVVLGADDASGVEAVKELYRPFDAPIIISDLNTAEMIKYASNAFLATRISFINEVARICDALGADVCTVADGMGLDPRIGRDFLNAGIGYGGSCFPKDVAALRHMAAEAGLHPQLLKAVTDINDDQRRWVADQLEHWLGGLRGKTIAVWGIAFKPNTDDTRSAPSLDIVARIADRGAVVRAYDPVVKVEHDVVRCSSAKEAATGADAILVATEWEEFVNMAWGEVARVMGGRLVFDGRNCLDREAVVGAGLTYRGVGRQGAARQLAQTALA